MSDTIGNGNLSPRGAEAVKRGLEDLNLVVDELEAAKQEISELRTQVAGYKVAMEAQDERVFSLDSRMKTAILERDQAVADLAVYETLFRGWKAQIDEFIPPRKPLGELDRDEWQKRLAMQSNPSSHYDPGLAQRQRSTVKPTIVPDTSGSA